MMLLGNLNQNRSRQKIVLHSGEMPLYITWVYDLDIWVVHTTVGYNDQIYILSNLTVIKVVGMAVSASRFVYKKYNY